MANNNNRNEFVTWLFKERFSLSWGFFLAVLPLLPNFGIDFLRPSNSEYKTGFAWLYEHLYFNPHHVVNILCILYIIIALSKRSFLMSYDEQEKEVKLHNYVKRQFGDNSTLATNSAPILHKRLRRGVAQFYFSWLAVWVVWLILYVLTFIFSLYKYNISKALDKPILILSEMSIFRVEALLENTLNLINSFILLFIYLVITVSTVRVGSLSKDGQRIMHACICVFALIFTGCFFTELFSVSLWVPVDAYCELQFYLRLVIGLIGAISMMAVLGRLNTNFLNIPQWMMLSLYLYAAIQVIYPMSYNPIYSRPNISSEYNNTEIIVEINSNNKTAVNDTTLYSTNTISTREVIHCGKKTREIDKKSRKKQNVEDSFNCHFRGGDGLNLFTFWCAFFGKWFLFFVLCWVHNGNRFLFFVVHKANTLSDSEVMLKRFREEYGEN